MHAGDREPQDASNRDDPGKAEIPSCERRGSAGRDGAHQREHRNEESEAEHPVSGQGDVGEQDDHGDRQCPRWTPGQHAVQSRRRERSSNRPSNERDELQPVSGFRILDDEMR
jgi:hypothetical protein